MMRLGWSAPLFVIGCLSAGHAWSQSSSESLPPAPASTPAPASNDSVPVEVVDENSMTGEKVLRVPHPNAAKGLVSIESDKTYVYAVPLREKERGATFGVMVTQPPNISTVTPSGNTITYQSMYGSGSVYTLFGNYEWMPFKRFGSLGVVFETGISNAHGYGTLASGPKAQESYSLFIVPLTVMLKYRFEYVRRQWVVPFIEGGGTYYGFAEVRDDGTYNLAGSEAVGGGGGLMFNITRWDAKGAFALDREFGVADMWFTLSARQMVGLKSDLDMTNTSIIAAITLDY